MKCIILAAGYATRLYPITENFPKPLLDVGGRTILDWLIDDIDTAGMIDEYIVVSNHKFANHFYKWAEENNHNIRVIDDGTSSNETRLGAVRDIELAYNLIEQSEDCFVMAGDNVLDFSVTKFLKYFKEKNASCVMRYFESNTKRLTKSGVLLIDENEKIIKMTEKPAEPESNWCCPPFYIYKAEDISRIGEAFAEGCGTDAPGSFVAWLCRNADVYAFEMPGKRYDIGSIENYMEIKESYKGVR
ncbi:MAG: nucleotidyltransferase family protein [Candidatus Ornithomonoglobus sp.]